LDRKQTPPKLGEWLLRSFCSYDFLNTALWDLEEIHEINTKSKGKLRADVQYVKDALSVIYHLYTKGKSQYSSNQIAMLKNNFIVALRNFRKDKGNASLNILGLSSALVVFILTMLYTSFEYRFDTYHGRSENIYRVYKSVNELDDPNYRDTGTPGPLAAALLNDFPEIEAASRFIKYRNILIEANNNKFVETQVFAADPSVFEVFTFEPVSGKVDDFLNEPYTGAISESIALKYFNRTDVIGETVVFLGQLPIKISGVFKDVPANSHLDLKILVHFESVMETFQEDLSRWNNNPYFTYLKTAPNVDSKLLEAKLPQLRAKYADDSLDENGQVYTYFLQPLKDVHFDQKTSDNFATPVDKQRLVIFTIVAIAILAMAIVNYMNLAIARSIVRTKEVGIRKIVGASKWSLVSQFLMESALSVFISLSISMLLVFWALPSFSLFVDRPLGLDIVALGFWLVVIAFGVGLTLISGIYPALVSSSIKPLSALNGRKHRKSDTAILRNTLVVFQFTVSCILIIGAMISLKQLNYIDTLDVGYDKENIVILSLRDDSVDENLSAYMDQLSNISGVEAVATSWSLPTNVTSNAEANWKGITDADRLPMYILGVTYDFFKVYGIELLEGRFFDIENASDGEKAMILNETAVKRLGWDQPLGREMITESGESAMVIGIVKDFHIKSLRAEIEPLQIVLNPNYARLAVKINGDFNRIMADIEGVYEGFSPLYPFSFEMFEDIYKQSYQEDERTAQLTTWLTLLTIIIAGLGLYSLAMYRMQRRQKELGVRKIMGASVVDIIDLLSKDMLLLIGIAFLLASPMAYYLMNGWLQGFAYHIDINLITFSITLLIMLGLAVFTIGYRTYLTAKSNPVEAIKG
jgi:putative ABC transport system permease protein